MKQVIEKYSLWMVLGVLAFSCAHLQKEEKSSDSQQVKSPKAPSVTDPNKPPTIRVEGLEADALYVDGSPLKIVLENYPVSKNWQGFELVLNDGSPERFFEPTIDYVLPPASLRQGANLLKLYLIRSWGESLKNPEAFVALPFYYGEKKGLSWLAPGRPVVTLVSPRGDYKGEEATKVLFDFIVHSEPFKKWTVHYTLNGEKRELSSGRSYHFEGLASGDYDLKIEVVNSRGIPLGQEATRARSSFSIEAPEPESESEDDSQ